MSDECKDFINGCLKKKPDERLGTKGGLDEILQHPWFKELDIQQMMGKTAATQTLPEERTAPGQSPFSGGEWIPWSQILNADQVRKQLEGKLLKDGRAATVMLPPWLARKKGYLRG